MLISPRLATQHHGQHKSAVPGPGIPSDGNEGREAIHDTTLLGAKLASLPRPRRSKSIAGKANNSTGTVPSFHRTLPDNLTKLAEQLSTEVLVLGFKFISSGFEFSVRYEI